MGSSTVRVDPHTFNDWHPLNGCPSLSFAAEHTHFAFNEFFQCEIRAYESTALLGGEDRYPLKVRATFAKQMQLLPGQYTIIG